MSDYRCLFTLFPFTKFFRLFTVTLCVYFPSRLNFRSEFWAHSYTSYFSYNLSQDVCVQINKPPNNLLKPWKLLFCRTKYSKLLKRAFCFLLCAQICYRFWMISFQFWIKFILFSVKQLIIVKSGRCKNLHFDDLYQLFDYLVFVFELYHFHFTLVKVTGHLFNDVSTHMIFLGRKPRTNLVSYVNSAAKMLGNGRCKNENKKNKTAKKDARSACEIRRQNNENSRASDKWNFKLELLIRFDSWCFCVFNYVRTFRAAVVYSIIEIELWDTFHLPFSPFATLNMDAPIDAIHSDGLLHRRTLFLLIW